MASKQGVICQKIVTSAQVNVANIEFPVISGPIRQIIHDAKLESLRGLLNDDWQRAARDLAKEYWGVK